MSGPTRSALVAAARGWLGTPYCHQASLRGAGCDCLGLVRGLWRECIGEEQERLPGYAPDWAEADRRETLATACARHLVPIAPVEARAGDVVLFRWRASLPAKHAGVLSAPDTMIHAHDGLAVTEVPLGLWRRRIAFAFCFPGVID